ncbi:hypothetical protein, unlikely [Trypanosoma brucei gambiense DAL972]|uniref:Uncharacterized protein n=1 Tax=Trypanosoma brucei gambiense (strain MHOM/CI/86/DAL972) TaxID=679716 RepID=D0A2Z5_TRYB9|nr:hypothetical protein, unlikely [Trypanosoma brucei gambiense DAL972]CBH15639.1 hypothetical protein, unlikely [Trypanosoma brucei gambiense DAL972]|eukprot:XP_011777903.1 hypothetical protein, unlikely [Trypanosoma brucei gambiense DAL972]
MTFSKIYSAEEGECFRAILCRKLYCCSKIEICCVRVCIRICWVTRTFKYSLVRLLNQSVKPYITRQALLLSYIKPKRKIQRQKYASNSLFCFVFLCCNIFLSLSRFC